MSNEVNTCSTSEDKSTTNKFSTKALCIFFFMTIQFPEEGHKSLCSPKKTELKVTKEAIYETVCKNHRTIMSEYTLQMIQNVKQTLLSITVTCEPR